MSRPKARIDQEDFTHWSMRDGSIVLVTSMEDDHLRLSIEKIKRENWRTRWLHTLQTEMFRRQMERAST